MASLHVLQNKLIDDGVIFIFRVNMTQEITETIGDAIKSHINYEQGNQHISRRVFSVIVEMVQNISHYAEIEDQIGTDGKGKPSGIILFGKNNNEYYIHCGNFIKQDEQARLKEKLMQIKEMNKDELKIFYREQRRCGPEASSMGAGLGFIEIARHANKIEFDFSPQSETLTFFSFKAFI